MICQKTKDITSAVCEHYGDSATYRGRIRAMFTLEKIQRRVFIVACMKEWQKVFIDELASLNRSDLVFLGSDQFKCTYGLYAGQLQDAYNFHRFELNEDATNHNRLRFEVHFDENTVTFGQVTFNLSKYKDRFPEVTDIENLPVK